MSKVTPKVQAPLDGVEHDEPEVVVDSAAAARAERSATSAATGAEKVATASAGGRLLTLEELAQLPPSEPRVRDPHPRGRVTRQWTIWCGGSEAEPRCASWEQFDASTLRLARAQWKRAGWRGSRARGWQCPRCRGDKSWREPTT